MENINNTELEQMKEQMNLLKEKIEKEKIVNQQLLRVAMKEKVSSLNRDAIIFVILGIVAIPYCTWVFISILNMSWWFIGVTDLFFLAAIVYTYFSHKDIKAKELMDGNLIEVSKKIMRMRRMPFLQAGIKHSFTNWKASIKLQGALQTGEATNFTPDDYNTTPSKMEELDLTFSKNIGKLLLINATVGYLNYPELSTDSQALLKYKTDHSAWGKVELRLTF